MLSPRSPNQDCQRRTAASNRGRSPLCSNTCRHFIVRLRVRQDECLLSRGCIGLAERGQHVCVEPRSGQVEHVKLSRKRHIQEPRQVDRIVDLGVSFLHCVPSSCSAMLLVPARLCPLKEGWLLTWCAACDHVLEAECETGLATMVGCALGIRSPPTGPPAQHVQSSVWHAGHSTMPPCNTCSFRH